MNDVFSRFLKFKEPDPNKPVFTTQEQRINHVIEKLNNKFNLTHGPGKRKNKKRKK